MNTPLGPLTLFDHHEALIAIEWGRGAETPDPPSPFLTEAKAQLDAYFDGRLTAFDLSLAPQGTSFQVRVWSALQAIPWGETRTYGTVATMLGTGPRAVGGACGRNPIPIIIPCHRVLGANGNLGGYTAEGGTDTKAALLRLEGQDMPRRTP